MSKSSNLPAFANVAASSLYVGGRLNSTNSAGGLADLVLVHQGLFELGNAEDYIRILIVVILQPWCFHGAHTSSHISKPRILRTKGLPLRRVQDNNISALLKTCPAVLEMRISTISAAPSPRHILNHLSKQDTVFTLRKLPSSIQRSLNGTLLSHGGVCSCAHYRLRFLRSCQCDKDHPRSPWRRFAALASVHTVFAPSISVEKPSSQCLAINQ
jgi:hypothetical protein